MSNIVEQNVTVNEGDIEVLRQALYEVEGRIAVVRSSIINNDRGLVFLTDKEYRNHEIELECLREDSETLKQDIRRLTLNLRLSTGVSA